MDIVANIIFKYFKNPIVKTKDLPSLYVNNQIMKRLKTFQEKSKFLETNLVNVYNITDLTIKEKTTTMYFYNYLLGGGGLNTKLYQLLREKNSLCYGVKSVYLKYDNLLVIQTSINKKDVNKAQKLIRQAFKEMKMGEFSDEEIENAKERYAYYKKLSETSHD